MEERIHGHANQLQLKAKRDRINKSLSQLSKAQLRAEQGQSLSPHRQDKHLSERKLLPVMPPRHHRHNPEKVVTEPGAIIIKFRTPRKFTEAVESPEKGMTDIKLSLTKKYSEDNPAYNLRRTYTKFHEANHDSPPPRTKKFKDFSYKDRYYDINRRLLQQTNIYLSADAWVAFDYRQAKYIRGWKVQLVGSAQNITKLLLINTAFRVLKRLELDPALMRMQILVPAEAKSHTQNRSLVLHDNTQISFLELMYGLMITSTEELYNHLMLNLGYLVYCYNQKSYDHTLLEAVLSHMMVSLPRKNRDNDQLYMNACTAEMRRSIMDLKMLCTELLSDQHYQMSTCCIDLCILMVSCLEFHQFKPMFTARTHTSTVRFQTGFNFSEERKIKWTTTMPWDNSFLGVCSGWRENHGINNNTMIAYHRQTNIIVVVLDSRFHFRTEDATKVVEWCMRNMKSCRTKTYLEECRETFMISNKHVWE